MAKKMVITAVAEKLGLVNKSEEQLYNEMFDVSKKKTSAGLVSQCHNCQHRPDTVCLLYRTVMNPNEHCSRWESNGR